MAPVTRRRPGDPSPGAWIGVAVRVAGAAAALIGVVWLALWAGGVPPRWSARGVITMKTNTALAHVLAGVALVLLGGRVTPGRRSVALVASAVVLLAGVLTLAEHLFQVDLGIDQLLATEPPGAPGAAAPNRMGPPAAVSFTLLGAGLLMRALERRGAVLLAAAAFGVVLVPAVGAVYGIVQLHSIPRVTGIAPSSTVGLMLLSVGLAFAPLKDGEVPLPWRRDPGGELLRRMLLPALLLPIGAGLVRLEGERRGLYGTSVGTGLFAVGVALTFALLLWRVAAQLSDSAAERQSAVSGMERAEEGRRQSELRYRTLFDSIDEGFCTIEVLFDEAGKPTDYRFIEVNGAFERQTGLVGVTGKRMRELAPSHEEHWFEMYGRVASTGAPIRFENRAEALGRWFDVYAVRVGEPEHRTVAVLFKDITERYRADQALRESEAALDAFFAHSPGILNLDDAELRYLKTDASTPRYFKLTRETIVGKSIAELAPEFASKFGPMMRGVLETGEPRLNVEVESPVPNRPGELTYWRASYFPVPLPGGKRGIGVMGVDITDLKHAEAALREVARRKDDFLGMLSHELRNPLAPIRNSIHVLRNTSPDREQLDRAHRVIERQTEHLTRLVDDLLDATRMSTGKTQLLRTRVELMDVVRHAVDDHRGLFSDRRITVDVVSTASDPLWVDGDPNRLAQVMSNLLLNSAKFTPEGGRVTVTVGSSPGALTAIIDVVDTGAGIERELLPRIFEPFIQGAQTLERKYGGLGLGLYIARTVVDLHGGALTAQSDGPGRGSRFRVELPLITTAAGAARGERPEAPHVARRVLVIEDNRDMAESLQEVLELAGHEVAVAFDGEDGIAKALEFLPDVVLCDIGLPKMNGYAVARALRAMDALGPATLIAVTGYASPDDRRHAADAGFDHHFAKPAKLDHILDAVRMAMPRSAPSATDATEGKKPVSHDT